MSVRERWRCRYLSYSCSEFTGLAAVQKADKLSRCGYWLSLQPCGRHHGHQNTQALDVLAFSAFLGAHMQILAIFAAAPELCQLVREVEDDYERFLQHPGRRPKGPYAEVLPFLAEQAQDWEASASATSSGASVPTVSVFPWSQYLVPEEYFSPKNRCQELCYAAQIFYWVFLVPWSVQQRLLLVVKQSW